MCASGCGHQIYKKGVWYFEKIIRENVRNYQTFHCDSIEAFQIKIEVEQKLQKFTFIEPSRFFFNELLEMTTYFVTPWSNIMLFFFFFLKLVRLYSSALRICWLPPKRVLKEYYVLCKILSRIMQISSHW